MKLANTVEVSRGAAFKNTSKLYGSGPTYNTQRVSLNLPETKLRKHKSERVSGETVAPPQ